MRARGTSSRRSVVAGVLALGMVIGSASPLPAQRRGREDGGQRGGHDAARDIPRGGGLAGPGRVAHAPQPVRAPGWAPPAPAFVPPHARFDARYRHNVFYPARGFVVGGLPRERIGVFWRGSPFYFHAGVWYRPYGPRYVVVAPPTGVVIPVLPPSYTVVWVGGVPYYYANGVYYAPAPQGAGYVVSPPPAGTVAADSSQPWSPPIGSDLMVYPRNGQSRERLFTDRAECAKWAAGASGYEPGASPPADAAAAALAEQYRRAEVACLEGRGYTVR